MEIPLWIILVPFGMIVACTALFLFFNIFHLARYGVIGRGAVALIIVYILSFLFVLTLGTGLLLEIDWTSTVPISSIVPFIGNASQSSTFGL
ncbi:MAG: hypothetical protein WCT28_00775 [Patescibacteria group bacterium]|jgi:hypothetical protein